MKNPGTIKKIRPSADLENRSQKKSYIAQRREGLRKAGAKVKSTAPKNQKSAFLFLTNPRGTKRSAKKLILA